MSGTATGVALDLDVLAALLRSDGHAVEGHLVADRIGRGQSNLTYLVRDEGGRQWIARRPPRGELLASAHDVLREHKILAALAGTAVPVPQVVGRYVDDALAETPVVIMEYVDGLVVDRDEVAERLGLSLRVAIGPSMARALAAVHEVDVDEVGLGDLASRTNYAARQLKRWSRQWEASRTRDLPRLDAMTELLRRRMPEPSVHAGRTIALVHGDFHLRNVIVDPELGDVRAVLDWELSTLGDPLADIGSLLAYWPEASDGATHAFAASALPGFSSREQVVTTYLEASGRERTDLDYWHALGLWKIAVIAEGVMRRALDEPTNAADGGPPPPEAVEQLVERAWVVAETAGLDD